MYVQNYKSVYIKHQLKAYILTKYEAWKCDNYKVTSRFYAMLDAKMYIVIVLYLYISQVPQLTTIKVRTVRLQ